jgi:hypothetical protein
MNARFLGGDETIALSFPGDVKMPFVAGTWSRRGDRIYAVFTPDTLKLCLDVSAPLTVKEQAEFRARRERIAGCAGAMQKRLL